MNKLGIAEIILCVEKKQNEAGIPTAVPFQCPTTPRFPAPQLLEAVRNSPCGVSLHVQVGEGLLSKEEYKVTRSKVSSGFVLWEWLGIQMALNK